MQNYNPNDHLHNFACWTAAAAVRRGFTTNKVIADAIERCKLKELALELIEGSSKYSNKHNSKCHDLIRELKKLDPSDVHSLDTNFNKKCTFGRAAKILAIYMKTFVVSQYINDNQKVAIVNSIYPPIDQILLDGLFEKYPTLKPKLKNYKWTKASEDDYENLKKILIEKGLKFDWTLEEYWKGYREGEG